MTGDHLRLRAAVPADVPAVAGLERLAATRPLGEPALLAALARDDRHLVVAEVAGRIVGTALVADLAGDAHVLTVAVAPAHRRRGVGRALLERVLAAAARSGCARATLEVRRSNAAARRLYARAAFEEVGVRPGYYPDGEDAVVLWCDDLDGRVAPVPATSEAPS